MNATDGELTRRVLQKGRSAQRRRRVRPPCMQIYPEGPEVIAKVKLDITFNLGQLVP